MGAVLTLFLHGVGHFHPSNEITNTFLEELDIGTSDSWILERVGIRSRRTVLPLDYIRETRNQDVRAGDQLKEFSTFEMSARAAEMALERAGLALTDVGMILCGSSASDYASPADACMVAKELGIDIPAFDVNSACTSFLAQIHLLGMMQPDKLPEFVLVCGSDSLTKTVDYSDRSAAVLWGDGAAAAILSTKAPCSRTITGTALESRPTAGDKVIVPRVGHFAQEGRTVQSFAIRKTAAGFEKLREEFESADRTLHFVGHQANLRMLEAVCRRCEIPDERHHFNVEWYGNTGAASSASIISMNWDKWQPHDDIAVIGVGAGLTWSRYLIRFGSPGEQE